MEPPQQEPIIDNRTIPFTPTINIKQIAEKIISLRGNGTLKGVLQYLYRIINGKKTLTDEYEKQLLVAVQCSTYEELLSLFPNITKERHHTDRIIFNGIDITEVASRLELRNKNGPPVPVAHTLYNILKGKTALKPEWESAILTAMGISSSERLRQLFPLIHSPRKRSTQYPLENIAAIIREITARRPGTKEKSNIVAFYNILAGSRPLTENWEQILLEVLNIPTLEQLLATFPKIRIVKIPKPNISATESITRRMLLSDMEVTISFAKLHRMVSECIAGKTKLPKSWESVLLTATDSATLLELRNKFPNIILSDSQKQQKHQPPKRFGKPNSEKFRRKSLPLIAKDFMELRDDLTFSAAQQMLSRILNGKIRISIENEENILKATECDSRKTLKRRFPNVQFEKKPKKLKEKPITHYATEMLPYLPDKTYIAICQKLRQCFLGKDSLPETWEIALKQIVGGAQSRLELRRLWPDIRFAEPDHFQNITDLMALIEGATRRSMVSTHTKVLNGKRGLPQNWEQPFMTVYNCTSRTQLKTKFPKIKFLGE